MLTSNHVNNEVIKFRKDVIYDFLRSNRLDPFMGASSTMPIVRIADLAGDGKQVNVPLVIQSTGAGVGVGQLVGNEETVDSYGMPLWADWARNAWANNRAVNKESSFSMNSTARSLARGWSKRIVRDDLVDALLSIPTAQVQANRFQVPGNRVNGIKWSAASAGQKNSWQAANYDRTVFGSVLANGVSGVFATSALLVDSTNDKMTAAVGSLMKAQAMQSGVDPNNPGVYNGRPKITPWMIEDSEYASDQEWYLCLCGSRGFRDLKADPTMFQANRDARERESSPTKNNPIFTGGGMIFDGIYYLEIPEITQRLLLKGVGTAGIDVEPCFLLGQAAMAYVMGQMPRPTKRNEDDYDFINGMGIEAQYGVGKIAKAPLSTANATVGDLVDFGMVTGFVSGVANA
jgi:hypothetical protein